MTLPETLRGPKYQREEHLQKPVSLLSGEVRFAGTTIASADPVTQLNMSRALSSFFQGQRMTMWGGGSVLMSCTAEVVRP